MSFDHKRAQALARRACKSFGLPAHEAEEIRAHVVSEVWRGRSGYGAAIDWMRHRKRAERFEYSDTPGGLAGAISPSPEAIVGIARALGRLPASRRSLLLAAAEGHSAEDAGALIGMPTWKAKTELVRARNQFAKVWGH